MSVGVETTQGASITSAADDTVLFLVCRREAQSRCFHYVFDDTALFFAYFSFISLSVHATQTSDAFITFFTDDIVPLLVWFLSANDTQIQDASSKSIIDDIRLLFCLFSVCVAPTQDAFITLFTDDTVPFLVSSLSANHNSTPVQNVCSTSIIDDIRQLFCCFL